MKKSIKKEKIILKFQKYQIPLLIIANQQEMNDDKFASIHQIVDENQKDLRNMQIIQLFQTPSFSVFDTIQLQHHTYALSNETFSYFIDELQKWNEKVKNKQVSPFSYSEFQRNAFVFSSLKLICLKKSNEIGKHLEDLDKWYCKNVSIGTQVTAITKTSNSNQEWEIRNTFRSNQPLEINNYRRRFLFSPESIKTTNCSTIQNKKRKANLFDHTSKSISSKLNEDLKYLDNQKDIQQNLDERIRNKDNILMKIKTQQLRKQREDLQFMNTQHYWRKSHGRFGEKTCQNFYKGKFGYNNKYFKENSQTVENRAIRTAFQKTRTTGIKSSFLQEIKSNRVKTSQGVRRQVKLLESIEKGNSSVEVKTQNNQEAKENWIDQFNIDQNPRFNKTFAVDGINLMSNPFAVTKGKMKKKKK